MSDLNTSYMGVKLANPIIVGACDFTANIKAIAQIEEMGAGALVTKSLFEEQLELEKFRFEEDIHKYDNRSPEMTSVSPETEYAGLERHLMWVREAKKAVSIPVFASLNALRTETWIDYARRLEDTGVNGLECNICRFPPDPWRPSGEIENDQAELIHELITKVSIPVSVKLSPFYTNPLSIIRRLDMAGASGLVLFNRLFEPDIDVDEEKHIQPMNLSCMNDGRLPLRYAGIMYGTCRANICCSGGISTGEQVVKMILAGSDTVQIVSVLYRYGIPHIKAILEKLQSWIASKNYGALAEFRGKLSQKNTVGDPWAFTRSQYVTLQMNPERVIDNAPVM